MSTVAIGSRVDADLKRRFEETALDLGVTPQVAFTVFMKRFVDDGGFPFEVRKRIPTEAEYAAKMDERYRRMLAGEATEHELIEA